MLEALRVDSPYNTIEQDREHFNFEDLVKRYVTEDIK
jgi:hypothetical protein